MSKKPTWKKPASPLPRAWALEARLMFDAAAVATAADALAAAKAPLAERAAADAARTDTRAADAATQGQAAAAAPAASPLELPGAPVAVALPWQMARDSAPMPPALDIAVQAAGAQLQAFLQQPDVLQRLAERFSPAQDDGGAWQAGAAQWLRDMAEGGWQVDVKVVAGSALNGALGAFAAAGPEGRPVIYLNAGAVDGLSAAALQHVLLEETGHAIDARLNGACDTAGDEGEGFAADVMGLRPGDAERARIAAEDDHDTITIDGLDIEVEQASLTFTQVFKVTPGSRSEEANDFVTDANALVGTRFRFQQGSPTDLYFSGNNVTGTLSYLDGNGVQQSIHGVASRLVKSGATVNGVYFYVPGADGLIGGADDSAYVLRLNPAFGFAGSTAYGTSSDPVDTALNKYIVPNRAPTLVNDTLTVAEDGGARSGNLLTNDADADLDTLSVTGFSVGGTTYTITAGASTSVSLSGVGSLTIGSDGAFSFTPAANYSGAVPVVSYTVSDGLASSTATLALAITPVNDAPSGADKTVTALEDTPYTFAAADFGFSDSADSPANTLQGVRITTLPAAGSLRLNGVAVTAGQEIAAADLGKLVFTPAANANGTGYASFTFQVRDNGGTANGGVNLDPTPNRITFNVTAVNDAPVAMAEAATATEAGGVNNADSGNSPSPTGFLLANDTDVDAGDTRSVSAVNGVAVNAGTTLSSGAASIIGAYGTLTVGADGNYRYVVDNDKAVVQALRSIGNTLSETFTYTVRDGAGATASAALTVTITGANDAPTAVNDLGSAKEAGSSSAYPGSDAVGNVLRNDTDVDAGDTKTVTRLVASATVVSATGGNSTLTVASTAGIELNNGLFAAGSTTVLGYVSAIGSGTVTLDRSVSVSIGASYDFKEPNGGGTWKTSGIATTTVSAASAPTVATVSGVSGTVLVGMTASGIGVTGGTTVTAVSGNSITLSNGVSAGTALSFSMALGTSIQGQRGTLSIAADGGYTYHITNNDLAAGATATETFTYEMRDTAGATSQAVLKIQIEGTSNDNEPDAKADAVSAVEAGVAAGSNPSGNVITTIGGSAGEVADTGGSLTIVRAWSDTAATPPTVNNVTGTGPSSATVLGRYGTLTIGTDGAYSYALNNGFSAVQALRSAADTLTETFFYRLQNGLGADVTTLTITIQGGNDGPVATADTAAAQAPSAATAGFNPGGNVLDNDSDVDDGDTRRVVRVIAGTGTPTTSVGSGAATTVTGAYGTLTIAQDGSYSYAVNADSAAVRALAAGATLTDTFRYEAQDTAGASAFANLAVTVTGAADAPVNTLPATHAQFDYQSAAIAGLSVADVDGDASQVVLTVRSGTLSITPGSYAASTYAGNGTAELTLTGPQATLNGLLATLRYQPDAGFNGADTLTMATSDATGLQDIDTLAITVSPDNRALTVSAPAVNEASPWMVFSVGGAADQRVTLELQASGTGSGHAEAGIDHLNSLEVWNGSAWQAYTGGYASVAANGQLLVRLAVLQDMLNEGAETLRLVARNVADTLSGGTGTAGIGTVRDDGTGTKYPGTVTGTTPDTVTLALDDDRPLAVTNLTINEASPYAVFTVTGAANQWVTLSLRNASASDADHGTALQVYDTGTSQWTAYTGGTTLGATGQLLVRTTITPDSVYEGPESFALVAANAGGSEALGTAVILDDGTGTKYPGTVTGTTPDTATLGLDNDLGVSVTAHGPVSEASPWAFFTVTATAGQTLTLALANTADTSDRDATIAGFTPLQFSTDGSTWTTYAADTAQPVVPGTGSGTGRVFVRVAIGSEQDAAYEGAETFTLTAATTTGAGASGTAVATIVDDGTGTRYPGTVTGTTPDTDTTGLDNDLRVSVTAHGPVNEASPYALFTVTATAGQTLTLALANTADGSDRDATIAGFTPLQFSSDGSTWTTYAAGTAQPLVPGSGRVFVRVSIGSEQDAAYEGPETFTLTAATATGAGASDTATATIVDGGTGAKYPGPVTTGTPNTETNGLDNDGAPLVTTSAGTAAFTEGANTASLAVAVDPQLTVSDPDSPTLASATVAITVGFDGTQDVLAFANTGATTFGNITASYNAGTGVLTLASSGATATLAQWQAALRAVTYANTSDAPGTVARTVSFAVNDGALSSNIATRGVTVAAVNDAPVLADTPLGLTVAEDAPLPVGAVGSPVSAFTGGISDVDSATKGIAITAADTSRGAWYYTTNGGATWQAMGTVSASSALLLADDANTRVYFRPNADWNGTVASGLTIKAWDQSSGTAGTKVNASGSTQPTLLGSYDTPGAASGVVLSTDGTKAYVADSGSGLQIIDISNPAAPVLLGSYDTPGSANEVALSPDGTRAYVADVTSGLLIIDISNPAAPALLGSYDTPGAGNGVVLSADGTKAYVADGYNGLLVLNVANPTAPTLLGRYAAPNNVMRLALSGDGTKAYVATGSTGLQIVSVANPAAPTLLGSYDTVGVAYHVAVSADGTKAYVADNLAGLQIINVANPAAPTLLGTCDTPGMARGVVLSADGTKAYVADGSGGGLQIVNVSDPAAPTLAGSYYTSNWTVNLSLSADGSKAYLATDTGGLTIVSLPSPSTAFSSASDTVTVTVTPVNDAPTIASPASVTVTEDVPALLTGISFADVDAASGNLTATLSVTSGTLAATAGSGVTVAGSGTGSLTLSGSLASLNAFIAAGQVGFTTAANATASVTLTTQVDDGGNTGAGGPLTASATTVLNVTSVNDAPVLADTPLGLTVAEDAPLPVGAVGSPVSAFTGGISDVDSATKGIAITAADTSSGAWYYTTNGGATWQAVGTVSASSALLLADDASTRLYFKPNADWNGTVASGLTIKAWDQSSGTAGTKVNASGATQPTLLGSYDTAGAAYATVLSADGTKAYVADYGAGLQIIDISNPAAPVLLGTYDTPGTASDVALSPDGTKVYVADSVAGGLQIISVANPAAPTLLGFYDTPGSAVSVALSPDGTKAYVADNLNGLHVINVANPAAPTLLGTYDTPGNAIAVALSPDGTKAYVADYSGGLQIINVTNAAAPTRLGFYTLGSAYDVTVSADGTKAYVAAMGTGLHVISIANPAAPTLLGTYDTPGSAYGVVLSADGTKAYVADGSLGLQIVSVVNPAAPVLLGTYDTPSMAMNVTLSADGSKVYVADSGSGVQIIGLPSPSTAFSSASDTVTVTVTPVNDAPTIGIAAAAYFDGVNDYIDLPTLTIGGDLALEAWVHVDAHRNWSRIIELASSGADRTNNIMLGFHGNTGRLFYEVDDNGVSRGVVIAPTALATGQWTHVAVSHSGSTATLYVNGAAVASGTVGAAATVARDDVYIARSHFPFDDYFRGALRDVRIWDTARTASDIAAQRSVRLTGNEAGLTAWYALDASAANGSAASGLDGTLLNGAYIPAYGAEDTDIKLPNVSFDDVDASVLEVRLAVAHGTLTLGQTTGLSFTNGDGSADAGMTFSGTKLAVNAAMATLRYRGDTDFNGTDTLSVTVSDLGATGAGGTLTASATQAIAVSAVNDAPTANADTFTVDEDSGATALAVLANDSTAPDSGETLSVIAVTQPTGGAGTVTLVGGVVRFTPTAEFSGTTSFTYTASDGNGGTAIATATVTVIPVNDTPAIAVPASITVTEDTAGALTGISFSDVDAGTSSVTVTLGVASGTLAAASGAGVTVGGTGSSLTLNGSIAAINAFIAASKVSFTTAADATAAVTLYVDIDDGGNTGTGGPKLASATTTLNVTPVNDAAVIGGDNAGAVTEDAATPTLTDAGTLTISDADTGEAAFRTGPGDVTAASSTLGSLSITSSGTWTYTVANSAVQYLKAGETKTEVFTVRAVDGTPHTITVVITGVNDTAVINAGSNGVNASAALTEDSDTDTATPGIQLTRSGSLAITDADAGQDKFSTTVTDTTANGAWGTLTITDTGAWSYSVDNSLPALQALAAGQTRTETFSIRSADGTATQTVTVVITGVNDAAVIGGRNTGTVTEDASSPNLANSGTLTIRDDDGGEAAFRSGSADVTAAPGTLGSLGITSSGTWTYTVANSAVQYLKAGETKTEVFTVRAVDGTAHTVTIVITGVNDAAVIGGDNAGAVTEDASSPNLTDSGTLTISDADTGEAAFRTGTADVTAAPGTLGSLSITAGGTWTYTVPNAAVQYLKAGETKTEVFTVRAIDGTAHTVSVVITGVNDAAVIGGDNAGAVTEDASSPNLTDAGALTISDADGGEAAFRTSAADVTAAPGTLGSLSITAGGTWTYTVSNAAVQYLKAGETKTETFTVRAIDGTAHDVTVVITGVNDAAAIDAGSNGANARAALTEDADTDAATPGIQLARSGSLAIADADAGQARFSTTVTDTTAGGAWGTLTITEAGTWSYSVNNGLTALQALQAGQTRTETFSVASADGTASQTISVVITGVNDAAVIGGQAAGTVTEDASTPDLTASGTLSIGDADSGQAAFRTDAASITAAEGTLGRLSLTAGGAWTYTVANGAVQGLEAGETKTEVFTVRALDGTAHTVSIAINGVAEPLPAAPKPEPAPAPAPAPIVVEVAPAPLAAPVQRFDSALVAPVTPVLATPVAESVARTTVSDTRDVGDIYTRSSGFRAMVAPANEPTLRTFRGIEDQVVPAAQQINLQVPPDAFVHTQANETVTLTATLADGRPLPTWLQFDGKAGTFKGEPPAGQALDLRIKVQGRDTQGREANAMFRIKSGSDAAAERQAGPDSPAEVDAANGAEAPAAKPRAGIGARGGLDAQLMRGDALAQRQGLWQSQRNGQALAQRDAPARRGA